MRLAVLGRLSKGDLDSLETLAVASGGLCLGTVRFLHDLLLADDSNLNDHLSQVVEDYVEAYLDDELLSYEKYLAIEGVALANLARSRGLRVDGIDPFVPSVLLVGS